MNYLVDTNVLSESAKLRPDPQVNAWLLTNAGKIYVSAMSIGELRRGIERLPPGPRKTHLHGWLVTLCAKMQRSVLSFNVGTAHVWGQLKAQWESKGLTVPALDGQIAATAHRHRLTLVTRNTADFVGTGIKLFNPFVES